VADVHRILLIPGSLRRQSTNVAVLRTAQMVAAGEVAALLFTGLGALPWFSPDDDEDPLDPAVADLRAQIRAADALLFSTPEYAGALPGAFKNLLDWTVGDDQPGSIYEKPVGWINASPRGAPNAHESLRRVLGYVKATIVEPACRHLPVTPDVLDENGMVADAAVQAGLAGALGELDAYVRANPRTSTL
jgi:NAD(P)H-dependent FMN reductase